MAFILLKDYISGNTGLWPDRFLESYSLYPRPVAFTSQRNLGLYFYMDTTETEPSVYYTRVSLQEVLQTMTFTLIFLALRYDNLFTKTSRLVKGITLMHVLWACYALSLGAGACLNPAFGLAQTTYWIGLAE